MSTNHAIVWIDRTEAHVLMFDRAHVEAQRIKSRNTFHKAKGGHVGTHQNKHGRGAEGSGSHSPEGGHSLSDEDYYHEVAQALTGVHEILVTGPAQAKNEFRAHCQRHDKDIDKAIVDVVNSDHPTDPQLVAMAKKYFLKYDNLQGKPAGS
jgi:stalled ribosome rescue protein Dom34